MITVIGMGPGGLEYITPIALSRAMDARILIGSDRLLELFPKSLAKKVSINKKMRSVVESLEEIKNDKVAVLVTGDPGLFSLLKMIKENIDEEYLEVIPGISAAQLLFSRALISWDDVIFVTLHGRCDKSERLLTAAQKNERLAVFNGPDFAADKIAKTLIDAGYTGAVIVGQRLSFEDESINEFTLEDLSRTSDIGVAVFLITLTTEGR